MNEEQLPLNSLQQWMQSALIFPWHTSAEQTEQILTASPRLTAAQRLAIYQRSYYLRILKCMEEQFPALCHALGKELFRDFAREYLQTCPSDSYTLYELGRRFPAYLQQTRPDREADERENWIDFMVDLARFERQVFVMFDAPGHEGKPLAEVNVPDHRLRLQPCFALGDFRFPVGWYYHEVRQGNNPELPRHERSLLALVRKDYLTHTLPLNAPHFTFLKALESGKRVDQALRSVAAEFALPIEKVRQSWADPRGVRTRWIEAGFFVAAE